MPQASLAPLDLLDYLAEMDLSDHLVAQARQDAMGSKDRKAHVDCLVETAAPVAQDREVTLAPEELKDPSETLADKERPGRRDPQAYLAETEIREDLVPRDHPDLEHHRANLDELATLASQELVDSLEKTYCTALVLTVLLLKSKSG